MGRRKIEIQPLTDDRNRTVTFVKRKAGLFKKAHELSVLCQVDIAVIIMGTNNRVYEFSSVDTKELILAYAKVPRLQEAKGPENYGKYKKKKHVGTANSKYSNLDDGENEVSVGEDEDLDYDSDNAQPDTKRAKRSYDTANGSNAANTTTTSVSSISTNNVSTSPSKNQFIKRPPPTHISLNSVPLFNSAYQAQAQVQVQVQNQSSQGQPIQDSAPPIIDTAPQAPPMHRPVLRVQIPIDAKENSSSDSAKTITALETSVNNNNNSNNENKANGSIHPLGHDVATNKDPLSATAPKPPLLPGGISTFKSPDSRRPMLPIPITKSLTSSPSSSIAPQLPPNAGMQSLYSATMPQGSPTSLFPPHYQQYLLQTQQQVQQAQQQQILQAQLLSQQQYYNNSTPNPYNKIRPPLLTGGSQLNGVGSTNPGEQTPLSGLPSRYAEMFPSPSAFYGSQEWPTTAVGFTPLHNSMPQYFGSLPSARPGVGPSGWPVPQAGATQPAQTSPASELNQDPAKKE